MKRNPIANFKRWLAAATCLLACSVAPAQDSDADAQAISTLEQKLRAIILPELEFEEASLQEGINYLRRMSAELDTAEKDPQRRGINFVILKSGFPDARPDLPKRIERQRAAVAMSEVRMLDLAMDQDIVDCDEEINAKLYSLAKLRLEEATGEMDELRNFTKIRLDLDGDELIRLVASEGDESSVIASLYRKYLDLTREIATQEGVAKNMATENLAILKKQLVDAVEHYKRALGTDMQLGEENLASVIQALKESSAELRDWRRRSITYRAAARDHELELDALARLEERVAKQLVEPQPYPATATLRLKNVPLEVVLKYLTQQLGLSYAVQAHAVVIGSAAEIAAPE